MSRNELETRLTILRLISAFTATNTATTIKDLSNMSSNRLNSYTKVSVTWQGWTKGKTAKGWRDEKPALFEVSVSTESFVWVVRYQWKALAWNRIVYCGWSISNAQHRWHIKWQSHNNIYNLSSTTNCKNHMSSMRPYNEHTSQGNIEHAKAGICETRWVSHPAL